MVLGWSGRCGDARGHGVLAGAGHGPDLGAGVRRGVSGARVPNACSGRAQSMPGTCSMKCQGILEVAVEAGN